MKLQLSSECQIKVTTGDWPQVFLAQLELTYCICQALTLTQYIQSYVNSTPCLVLKCQCPFVVIVIILLNVGYVCLSSYLGVKKVMSGVWH